MAGVRNTVRPRLTLRAKTTLGLLMMVAGLIAVVSTLATRVTLRSYEDLERAEATTNVQRMYALLSERVAALHTKCADWSTWDDTYLFISDHNEEYVASNLDDSALALLDINLMAFIDQQGQVVFEKVINLDTGEAVPVSPDLEALALQGSVSHFSGPDEGTSGVFSCGDTAIIISARPVLTTNGEGPVNGSVVFGRYMDEAYISSLAESAKMAISLTVLGGEVTGQGGALPVGLSAESPCLIEPDGADILHGYQLGSNPSGEPAILLTADIPRDIYQAGQNTVRTFALWAVGLMLLVSLVWLVLLDALIVRRLTRMSREVAWVDRSSPNQRVSAKGTDEIASLGLNINAMLDSLSSAQQKLRASRDGLEAAVEERTAQLSTEMAVPDSVLAAMPMGVVLTDLQGNVLLVNQAFHTLFAPRTENQESMKLGEFVANAALAKEVTAAAEDAAQRRTYEFRHHGAGQDKLLKADIIPIGPRILVLFEDMTESRETQDRLYLTDRLASVGEMAAGVAHELNNPLTSVVGLAELALESHPPAQVEEDLRLISSEAQRAGGIVKNLLSFARKHAPAKNPVQLNEVIGDVLRLRAYDQTVNNIIVERSLDPELPEVMTDYFQMQQVFLNLVLNAEQAMTEAHAGGTLRISSRRVGANVNVSFGDDGPGIPRQNLERIFDPFFTTKEVGKGTGLGLSICYGIVTAHGGRIRIDSEVGRGATFVVELPVAAPRVKEVANAR